MPFDFSTYQVAPGEKPASSSKYNAFLDAAEAAMNAMPPANLVGFPSDVTKFLNGAGGWSSPPTDLVVKYVKTAQTDVVNTVAATDLFGGAFTIEPGKLSADGSIKVYASGDYLNDSGSSRTIRLQLALGATTIWDATSDPIADPGAATRRAWWFELVIQAMASTSAQQSGGEFFIGDATTAAAVGTGQITAANLNQIAPYKAIASALNMSGSQPLTLKVTHAFAATTISMRCAMARVEVTS